jgi:DNA-directed RNA polymerase specialized sigma24 family protein
VFNLINRITQNIEVAEAVLIEAFLSVAEFANDRPDDPNIERTLIQIAVRKALLRAPQDSIFPDETHSDAQFMIYRDILPWRWDSLDPLTPKELAQTLDRALQHLAPVDRAIFVLKDVEAMSINEAAGVVCLPIPVVKRRLLSARLRVAAELSKSFARE